MNHIKVNDWLRIKAAVSSNGLAWEYATTKLMYMIFASSATTRIQYNMRKRDPRSSEQIDFEDNIKDTAKKW